MKKPQEHRGLEPRESEPESQEILSFISGLREFSDDLVAEAIENFWPSRPRHPELNDNGVSEEELVKKVGAAMRVQIAKNLPQITSLLRRSRSHEEAEAIFDDLCAIYVSEAEELMRLSYESLINLKKTGIDELTGLPNRKVFDRSMRDGIERNLRFGQTFSFIIFDLDHFKQVNDQYGHQAGDEVLKEMARRLSKDSKLRKLDAVVRYGGEEFALILPGTPKVGACIVAQRISDQIGSEPFLVANNGGEPIEIVVTTSIGVSEFTNAIEDPEGKEVQRRADTCLYILKGKEPDIDGFIADRRGQIACDNRVLKPEEIQRYKEIMRDRPSSFLTPRPA